MEIIKRIYTLLLQGNGLKIREIAKTLELDKYLVADVMFSMDCIPYWYQDESSLWYAKKDAIKIEEPEEQDTLVQNIILPQNINKEIFLKEESGNCLNIYLEEIIRYRIYTDEEVTELFRRYRNGDNLAYNLLVKSHLRLVVNIARLYKYKGVHLEDIIQEGNIGLLKAIERFDYTQNNRFIIFAKACILQGILSSIMSIPHIIRIPYNQIVSHWKLQKFNESFEQTYGRSPGIDEINADIEPESLKIIYNFPSNLKDLAIFINDWDSVYNSNEKSTDYTMDQESDSYYVHQLLHLLNEREQCILKSYYGIDCKIEETLNVIGEQHGVTRERARQLVLESIQLIQKRLGIKVDDE